MSDTMYFDSFFDLVQIFVKKKWVSHPLQKMAMENFGKLLLNLTDLQRKLIMELAERYCWLTPNELDAKLTNVLKKIEPEKLNSAKRIIVFPIMKPEDEHMVKSGHGIIYKIRGLKPFLSNYNHLEILEIIKYSEIEEENFYAKPTDLIYLVDDYLGSGETLKATLDLILKNRSITIEQLNIITIASQADTITFVQDYNIPLYFEDIQKRGITDYYEELEAEEKIKVMREIERLIPGSNFFSLGYNESEALITLTRTPDNTFPIFWKDHKKNGQEYKAPFPRY